MTPKFGTVVDLGVVYSCAKFGCPSLRETLFSLGGGWNSSRSCNWTLYWTISNSCRDTMFEGNFRITKPRIAHERR